MNKELIQKMTEELESIEKQHTRSLIDNADFVRKKLKFFSKYAEYEKEFIYVIKMSRSCFVTYVPSYLDKEDNRYIQERMELNCLDAECDICCKRDIYDYLLRNINRLSLV